MNMSKSNESLNIQSNKIWKSNLDDIQEKEIENTLQVGGQNQYEIDEGYMNLEIISDKREDV